MQRSTFGNQRSAPGHGARRGYTNDLLINIITFYESERAFQTLREDPGPAGPAWRSPRRPPGRTWLGCRRLWCRFETNRPSVLFFLTAISHWGPQGGCLRSQLIKCKVLGVWCLAQGYLLLLTRTPPKFDIKIGKAQTWWRRSFPIPKSLLLK